MIFILPPCILVWNIVVSRIAEAGEPVMEKTKYTKIVTTQGNTAILPCLVSFRDVENNDRRKYSVTWTDQRGRRISINERVLQNHRKFQISHPYPDEWNLQVIRAHSTDGGQYKCQVNSSPVQTKIVDLLVQVPPRIDSSESLEVKEHERLVIFCNVTGVPPPTVQWFKDNEYLSLYTGEKLVIREADRNDTGLYRCVAENGVGPSDSEDITVDVLYAPTIQSLSSRFGHNSVVLECDISANPEETVTWYDNNRRTIRTNWKYKITKSDHLEGCRIHSLEIQYFAPGDLGDYECTASNTAGSASERITVTDVTTSTTMTSYFGEVSSSSGSVTYIPDKSEQKDNEVVVPGRSSRSSSCCYNLLLSFIIAFIYISL